MRQWLAFINKILAEPHPPGLVRELLININVVSDFIFIQTCALLCISRSCNVKRDARILFGSVNISIVTLTDIFLEIRVKRKRTQLCPLQSVTNV